MTPYPNNSIRLLKTEIRDSIALSIPLAAAQFAQASTGFVDTVMMGWMGPETLAAGGLATALFMAIWVGGLGLTNGVTALMAEAYGAQQSDRMTQILHQGLLLALLLSLPAMLVLLQGETLMRHAGQPIATAHLAQSYLRVIAWAYFPAIVFVMLRGVASSMNSPRIPMVISIGGLVFNALGNYVLGFGHWGFPVMGLTGLAIASAMSHGLMALSLLLYLFFHHQFQELLRHQFRFNFHLLWQLFKLGLPIGISFLAEAGLFSVTTFLMGNFGVSVLAAHQIVFQTIAIIFMLPLGVSYATTIRVGQALGKQDWAGIKRSAFVGMALGGGIMAIAATLVISFPTIFIRLYLDLSLPTNQALVPIATSLFTIAALAQILDGIQTTAAGALRGLQDTRVPMVLSFIAFWMVGLTMGCGLAFGLGLGGAGLWMGQSIGLTMAAILFVIRFLTLLKRANRQTVSE